MKRILATLLLVLLALTGSAQTSTNMVNMLVQNFSQQPIPNRSCKIQYMGPGISFSNGAVLNDIGTWNTDSNGYLWVTNPAIANYVVTVKAPPQATEFGFSITNAISGTNTITNLFIWNGTNWVAWSSTTILAVSVVNTNGASGGLAATLGGGLLTLIQTNSASGNTNNITNNQTGVSLGITNLFYGLEGLVVCPYTNLPWSITNSPKYFGPWLGADYVQQAINALAYATNPAQGFVGGGRLWVVGTNYFTNSLKFTNALFAHNGQGAPSSWRLESPSFGQGALIVQTPPAIKVQSTNSASMFEMKNVIVASLTDAATNLVEIGPTFGTATIEDCWFGSWFSLTNNRLFGNLIGLTPPTTGNGNSPSPAWVGCNLVGLNIVGNDSDIITVHHCHFFGLACGIFWSPDHGTIEDCQFSYCGPSHNLWTTSYPFVLGCAIVLSNNINNDWFFKGNYFYQTTHSYFVDAGYSYSVESLYDGYENGSGGTMVGVLGSTMTVIGGHVNPSGNDPPTVVGATVNPYTVSGADPQFQFEQFDSYNGFNIIGTGGSAQLQVGPNQNTGTNTGIWDSSGKGLVFDESGNGTFTGTVSGPGSGLTSLNASHLSSGTLPSGVFPATLPAASGVNLTALNASQLTSGTVPIAQLPMATTSSLGVVTVDGTTITLVGNAILTVGPNLVTNGPLLNGVQTWKASGSNGFSGTVTALNGSNSFAGNGNGLTSLTAGNLIGNIGIANLTNATTNVFPLLNNTNTFTGSNNFGSNVTVEALTVTGPMTNLGSIGSTSSNNFSSTNNVFSEIVVTNSGNGQNTINAAIRNNAANVNTAAIDFQNNFMQLFGYGSLMMTIGNNGIFYRGSDAFSFNSSTPNTAGDVGLIRGGYRNLVVCDGSNTTNNYASVTASNVTAVSGFVHQTYSFNGNYTLVLTNDLFVQTASTNTTNTLPTASTCTGRQFTIKMGGTGSVVISAANIDGATTKTITTQYDSITVHSDGTQYWIDSEYGPGITGL